MIPAFEHKVIEEDERTIVFRGAEGITHRALKEGQARGTRMSMDQYLRFPVETRADFEAMKKRYVASSAPRYPAKWDEQVETWKRRDYPLMLTGIGGFGLYSMLRRWMGTEKACTLFYDDPPLAEEMLDFLTDFFIELTQRALEAVDVDWWNCFEDFAFKTGPLVSPDIYKRFLLRRYQRIIKHLRRHGVDIISLDSDGNIEVLLPLIMEAGFNHICPLEQAAGMDAVKIRKQYGRAFALLGSIDKREIAKGKREIEQELLRQLPFLLESGGYIPTIDHSIPPDVSYDNFLYYLAVKKKLIEGRYGA
jgi:uroporphyrinogen decarboxylase